MTGPLPHSPSTACYRAGCKQPACLREGRRRKKILAYDLARGHRWLRDASQARAHIARLTASLWTHREIGEAIDVPRSTISMIAGGHMQQTSHHNVLAILSIPIGPPPPDHKHVMAIGSTRRVRALAALGYSLVSLAGRLDMSDDRIGTIARGVVTVVARTEAEAVAALYRQLCTRPGPSDRARNQARRKGWHGPMAWDDIDDLRAKPEPPSTDELALKRNHLAGLRREEIVHLAWCGYTPEAIRDRLNQEVALSTIQAVVHEWKTGRRRDRRKAA